MSLGDLLAQVNRLAAETQIPANDYYYVISHSLDLPIPQLFMQKQLELSEEHSNKLQQQIKRVQNHEPPQYICGKACFYGWELQVNPEVLIPRQETEGLVELVLLRLRPYQRVLDVGTGSGAIAIAMKLALPELLVDALDISEAALQVARLNAETLQAEINFIGGNLLPIPVSPYDAIVSNPPYISQTEYDILDIRVREHEPKYALLAEDDGLFYYRELLSRAGSYLVPGGFLALECGAMQRAAITAIAIDCGWKEIEPYKDLCGRDRYLLAYWS